MTDKLFLLLEFSVLNTHDLLTFVACMGSCIDDKRQCVLLSTFNLRHRKLNELSIGFEIHGT